jgi:hypothetical protein
VRVRQRLLRRDARPRVTIIHSAKTDTQSTYILWQGWRA